MKIKKGDTVKIISGNDRGKTGTVAAVLPQSGRITVPGINVKKKHVRPRRQGDRGEIVLIPAPFAAARAMRICPSCGRPARVGLKKGVVGRVRICKRCGAEI